MYNKARQTLGEHKGGFEFSFQDVIVFFFFFFFFLCHHMLDSDKDNGLSLKKNSSHDSREVPVGKDIMISCPILSDVIQLDGAFKSLYWSYCTSSTCNTAETTWSWMAGMNSTRNVKVTHKGAYAGRVNLTRNGTLVLSNVRVSDSTDYRCTVQRVNFTSPRTYFFTLVVDATGETG